MPDDNAPDSPVPGLSPAPDDDPQDGGWLGRLWTRAVRLYDARLPAGGPIPASEEIALDLRQHRVALVAPAARTVLGLLAQLSWPHLLPTLLFAGSVGAWSWRTLRTRAKGSLVAAGVALVLLVVFGESRSFGREVLFAAALLAWLGFDAVQWHEDRLVVTTKRIYRVYGLLTKRAPSISLTGIAYIDTAVHPLGRLLHYGVLHLDSAAQEDVPLSSIRFVPDVLNVHQQILELRGKAMPKFPSTPP